MTTFEDFELELQQIELSKENEKLQKKFERERVLWIQWNKIANKEIKKRKKLEAQIEDFLEQLNMLEQTHPDVEGSLALSIIRGTAREVFGVGSGEKQEKEESEK